MSESAAGKATRPSVVPTLTSPGRDAWPSLLEAAAREVFDLMLGCPLNPATVEPQASLAITSMVGIAGALCGVLSLRCTPDSARAMASKMLGLELETGSPEMADALGEICNMVAGNFKNKIPGLGDGCMLSPPTVVTGSDYTMQSLTDEPVLELQLSFEGMPVVISLQIHG